MCHCCRYRSGGVAPGFARGARGMLIYFWPGCVAQTALGKPRVYLFIFLFFLPVPLIRRAAPSLPHCSGCGSRRVASALPQAYFVHFWSGCVTQTALGKPRVIFFGSASDSAGRTLPHWSRCRSRGVASALLQACLFYFWSGCVPLFLAVPLIRRAAPSLPHCSRCRSRGVASALPHA